VIDRCGLKYLDRDSDAVLSDTFCDWAGMEVASRRLCSGWC